MIFAPLLLSLTLLLAPLLSGIPDEPKYSSWLCAVVFLAALFTLRKKTQPERVPRTEAAFAALLGIALLSLLWRLVAEGSIAYLGPMLRGWMILGTELCLFVLSRRAARFGGSAPWILLGAVVLASAIVADMGLTEYIAHRRAGQPDWRIFSTSTPDFLAGYLVLLLPPTLSLFIGIPWQGQKSRLIPGLLTMLLLIVVGLQALILLRTQSRFALVSLTAGLIVFGLALWKARRAGLSLERSSWQRLAGLGVGILLFGLHYAGPVIGRLRHTSVSDNSTAFRLYTWRGCVRMAAANPVLGTGIGSWVHLYPRYAITGFTRLAHNSYLQMADECGLLGLLALLATLGLVGVAVWRGLETARAHTQDSDSGRGDPAWTPFSVSPLLLAGLAGGLAASVVQNLIDSDWYVFFLGVTFWGLAGLAVGLAEPALPEEETPAARPFGWRMAIGALIVLMGADMAAQGVAASDAQQAAGALASTSPAAATAAEQELAAAMQWDPLNGKYPADLGLQVYLQREGRVPDALAALETAVRLEPSSLNYAYLAAALNANHQFQAAVTALQRGIRSDPNSVTLRLTLAQMLPPPQSVNYCRQIAQLEKSPVGRVRALGNLVDYQFAIADAYIGDADAAAQDTTGALRRYTRAKTTLEAYADEGGSADIQRRAVLGGHPDPGLDHQMQTLYAHIMQQLITLSPPAAQPALRAEAATYAQKFAQVFTHASQPGTF